MNWKKGILTCGVSIALLTLTGCDPTPEKVAEWKAAGNTKKLIKTLEDHRQFMRIEAMDALAELKAREAIAPLARLLSDRDQFIVHKALEVLAGMEDPSIEPHMIRMLSYKTSEARQTAAEELGKYTSKAAVKPLIDALDDNYDTVVVAAAASLGKIGDPEAVAPLVKLVDNRSYSIRMAAVTALRQLGGSEAMKGLAPALGDINSDVRNSAAEGLVKAGPSSEPLALAALRSDNHFARGSGVAILNGLNRIPPAGSKRVWYEIAALTADEHPKITREKAKTLTAIDDSLDALLTAAANKNSAIRDYGCLALEAMGESVVSNVMESAEARATAHGTTWYNQRTEWSGAPAWEIDLWGAAALLNPRFVINARMVSELKPHSHSAEQLMKSPEFQPRKQYIPYLIAQFGTLNSEEYEITKHSLFGLEFTVGDVEFSDDQSQYQVEFQRARNCRRLARQHLIDADYRAFMPLLAALDAEDLTTAAWAAITLFAIDPDQAERFLLESVERRMANRETLSSSPLYTALQLIDRPAVQTLALKVRPDYRRAVRFAEEKYPGTHFVNVPLDIEIDDRLKATAAPFKLLYSSGKHQRVLKVVFRPDENGDWRPDPPLPDELPN